MSRIGKSIITIPAGVTVSFVDNVVTVKGPKGELSQEITGGIILVQEGTELMVNRPSDSKEHRSLHGLYRALINNMIIGTSEGFTKQLELVGVGYRASHSGQKLELALGFSHGILMELPKEITEDPSIYPPAEILQKSYWQDDVGDAIQYYEQYYQELKAAK